MSQQSSQNKQQCPNYNKHFPWSFLLNYGPALQDMSDENILSRLKEFNCEWLSRPNITISEMAQTIKNWHLIHKMRGKVLTRNFVDNLEQVIVPLMDQYWFLNNKDNTTHDAPAHDDILEVINTQPDMEQLMIQGFNAAGPLLMVSIQMLTINALLHNVEKFAYEAVRSPATGAFKVNPYQDTMMDYLFDAILMRCRPMQRRDSLYDRRRLANRQSGYQQPTRTSSKRFQDSCH